jgi:predicted ATPase/class 3 adenylate cyclase
LATHLPTGTISFLFTDIGSSTQKWERMPRQMYDAVALHDALLREAIECHGGVVFKSLGDGVCAAFDRPDAALSAAIEAQRRLLGHPWGEVGGIEVRMGIHTGQAELREGDYFGTSLSRVARIMGLAYPGQILVSQATAELVGTPSDGEVRLIPLGAFSLKGLARQENVHQVVHPDLRDDFPPPPTGAVPDNLPADLSLFVGRDTELQELLSAMRRSRMVSITGSGGSGKTRLAIEAGRERPSPYRDGVWLVELAPLSDSEAVVSEVAQVLSILPDPGTAMMETLVRELRAKNLLIVLDNCEHLLDACAHLAQRLLRAAPEVHVLATSREALAVPGEIAVRIPSMSLPDQGKCASVEDLARYDACSLFLQRASEAAPSFAPEGSACETVAQICRRLDGIPLALELAASRLRAMPLSQLVERLDDRFRVLTGGSRTAVSRQRTLRALIDWSYDLLTPEEQSVLRSLAVFSGGWTLEAAEQVAAHETVEQWQVLDLLAQLVEKSLVTCTTSRDGRGRYGMLETIRQYATDRAIDEGETKAIRDRHLRYFYSFVHVVYGDPNSNRDQRLRHRMHVEWENVRSAVEWAISEGDSLCLKLLARLHEYLHEGGRHREGLSLINRALIAVGETGDAASAGKVCLSASALAMRQLDFDEEEKFGLWAHRIFQGLGDEVGVLRAEARLAHVDIARGRLDRAREAYARLAEEWERLNHLDRHAEALYCILLIEREAGDLEAAEALLPRWADSVARQGSVSYRYWVLHYRAWMFEARGDCSEAASLYAQALVGLDSLEYENARIWQWECLARVFALAGRYAECARLFGACAFHREQLRWPVDRAEIGRNAAAVRLAEQSLGEAYEEHRAAGRAMTTAEAHAFALAEAEAICGLPPSP